LTGVMVWFFHGWFLEYILESLTYLATRRAHGPCRLNC
jgi:hypothetical protein